jgi:hypothetical protein
MIISNLPIDLGRVKQNYSTDNENRPLLMSGVAGVSSTSDRGSNESVVNNSIYANPSTGTIHANISGNITGSSGSCTGNAATATALQTARSINGTSFDGTANITTANWGTARNISITDGTNTSTAVSVNGSKAYSLNLPSTIKATFVGNITGNVTGNADSATKLQTARTINGTSFNGSGNITTANWGTARNVSIQDHNAGHTSSAVSVNGSGNVNLKLPSTINADIDFPITEAEIEAIFNGTS